MAQSIDQGIRDKLAAPPISLDENHQGPTMVPRDLPTQIFPFDCRATQAYIHRLRPGEYHFQRAQRLLGQGIDVIGCEAFGLQRFTSAGQELLKVDQAVREAESALAVPIGLEQWAPGALRYILISAYGEAAKVYAEIGNRQGLADYIKKSREFKSKAESLKAPDVGRTDRRTVTRGSLITAVLKNDLNAARYLLSQGADVNAIDGDYTSALRLGVVAGHTEMVRFLLSNGAAPDVADEEGVTALMDACSMGRSDVALTLIEAGADINARANDGSTPLLNAVGRVAIAKQLESRREIVQSLVRKGAAINVSDWFGTSPLIAATRSGDSELIRSLLALGADIEARDADGETPLISAVSRGHVTSVKVLLEKRPNLNAFNKRGGSALSLAAKNGYPEGEQITHLLLLAGADPNLANPGGRTPLMSAEGFNYREPWGVSSHAIVRELLDHNANVNARSNNRTTPLIIAAGHVGPDDASFLIELVAAGADVNAADEDGQTALMAAAELGHVSKVEFLLAKGAQVKVRDKAGRTALQYARPPKNNDDDVFPQCYDSLNGDGSKRTNDCKTTRRILKQAFAMARESRH